MYRITKQKLKEENAGGRAARWMKEPYVEIAYMVHPALTAACT
jgi:hypothetical protein